MLEPLKFAAVAIEALNRREWDQVAAVTDPDEVERWYRAQVDVDETPLLPATPDEVKQHQPDLPDAVAEYHAQQINRQREKNRGSLHGQFASVSTREELAALSPAEALARFLQAQDPTWKFQERLKTLDRRPVPFARQGTPSKERKVVGVVYEGEQVAHVVYRGVYCVSAMEGGPDGEMHVATLRKAPVGWRLRLRGGLFEHGGCVVILECDKADESANAAVGCAVC